MHRIIHLLFLLLIFIAPEMSAQTPLEAKLSNASDGGLRSCTDQFAGTWRRGSFLGSSNDILDTTIYLCRGDQLQVLGNNDANLSGDPVAATAPGVGYGFYACPPSISGPGLTNILNDPCIALAPPPTPLPANGIYVARELGNNNGDLLFRNDGTLQSFFNNGLPVSLWFAPITLDDFNAQGFEGGGQCAHVNTDVAFNIVYLNAIEIIDFTPHGVNPLQGAVRVRGGLPEFANSGTDRFYGNIVIELTSNPTIRGTVVNGNSFRHNEIIEFTVPQPGTYRIRISDSKACPASFTFTLPQNNVEIILPQTEVDPNATICIPITVNNFRNVVGFQFAVTWDPTILRYNQFVLPSPPPIGDIVFNANGPNGEFRAIWDNSNPINLPDGTVLFELCFEAIGNPGDSSYIRITNRPIPFEVIANDVIANTIITNGGIKIRIPQTVTAYARSCSTTGSSGSITFSAVGGTPPYTYLLEKSDASIIRNGNIPNPADWITENNLTSGSYYLEVRDANNAIYSIPSVNVFNGSPLFISLNTINPRCFDEANGRVVINSVGGGEQPYTFKWSIGQFGGNEIRQLPAGNYGVTVIDANGCTAFASTTLGVTRVTASFNPTRPSCSGKADGRIEAMPMGGTPGTPAYRYLWSDFSTGSTLENAGPGCYRVTITDGNNCSFEQQICIDPIKTLEVEITPTLPTCHRETDGSIALRAFQNGGSDNPPYTFNWSDGTVVNNPPDRSSIVNLAGNRTYLVTITDADGCNITRTIDLADRSPVSLFLFNKSDVSCGGNGMDGSLQVVGTGGSFIYNYLWSTGANTGSINNLVPGIYRVTVTDSNGCTATGSYEIELEGPDLIMSATPVTCPGGFDGTASVQFTFPGSSIIRWQNGSLSNTITGLNSGWYFVTVTSTVNGVQCDKVDSVFVSQPEPLSVIENNTPPTCPADNNGILELNVSGGSGNYSFQWSHVGIDTNRLINQRGGQSYTVTISDGTACPPLVYNFFLPRPELIRFRFTQLVGVSCPTSSCDGSVRLELFDGAVPNGTFRIEWGNGQSINGVTEHTLNGLCVGTNTITVTDQNGCVQTSIVVVPGPVPISLNPDQTTIQGVSCNGDTDGSAFVVPVGGTGPYTIFWPSLNLNGVQANNLPPGQYLVQITDARDCVFDTLIRIIEPELLTLQIDPTLISNVGCSGANDGQIGVVAMGGNQGNRTYIWSNGSPDSPIASGLAPGTYSVTVIDSRGCEASTMYTLSEPVPISAIIPVPAQPACFGQLTFITVSSASGGSGSGFVFNVDNGPLTPLGATVPVLAGSRLVRVFDDKGCTLDSVVVIDQPDEIVIDLPNELEIDLGDTIALEPFISSDLAINMYNWSNGATLSCNNCQMPNAFPSNSTTYTLLVTDTNGCTASASVRVTVSKRRNVFIPDAFTPNADGLNDKFVIFTGRGVAEIPFFKVYNRWGSLMFQAENINPEISDQTGWDGKFNGEMMDMGVYIYTAQVRFLDGTVLLYRGEVTMIR
jgi:gliding motility-associated-like protein